VASVQEYLRTDEGLRSGGSGLGLKSGQGQNEWLVLLDGRALRTPKDNRFIVPSRYLAHAIAAEWDAQVEKVKPSLMPLVRNSHYHASTPFPFFSVTLTLAPSDVHCYNSD
jgi:hypothetical protein